MRLLVLSALLVQAWAGIVPQGFQYQYSIPMVYQGFGTQPWTPFVDRSGAAYPYGYPYPGQLQYESKDPLSVVPGTTGYIDPNGLPVFWQYVSDPASSFVPQVSQVEEQPQPEAVVPAVYSASSQQQEVEVPVQEEANLRAEAVNNLTPLLKQAAEVGNVKYVGTSSSGSQQFEVSAQAADEAGGVSALAYSLGAIPVAAVHDAQSPSASYSSAATSPVLVHQEHPEITLYTLEVPVQ